jgi:D-3-phosphoglycerate dehydrogenase
MMNSKKNRRYHVVVADPLHQTGWESLVSAQDVEVIGPFDCDVDLRPALANADALLICSDTNVDAELLKSAPRLKVVARAGARLDNVDIDEATRRGIFVIHVPDANVVAVVEYTFLLMLELSRHPSLGKNESSWRERNLGFQLAGKSLGIVGFGRQGREVAYRAQAFGMRVMAYDPYIDLSFARESGVECVDLPELLARADILTLHTVYTPQTHRLFNPDAFAQVKPGAYLVNCVHSNLVDESALLDALDNGKLAGAALDTWDEGIPAPDSPLRNHPKILITHNQGLNTIEARVETASSVVSDTLALLRGHDYRNVVNLPFNKDSPYQSVKPYMELAKKLGKLQGQLADGWITKVEVELIGDGLQKLVRPVTAVLLSGMILPVDERPVNWVSAPVLAYEQGITTSQAKNLVDQRDYPALIVCRTSWETGQRTVAGALFGNGEARLVAYDEFAIDAYPDGYVLILENEDKPGLIGKVGTRLSQANINIAQWRYGRDFIYGRGVSFINLDHRVPSAILAELKQDPDIRQARLVKL